ncbi:MAG: hypothetical protein J0L92_20410 [Deltaproteobacteria bacterium]|nr:hypothetical protein [Deltaproteobacteria bacterium]
MIPMWVAVPAIAAAAALGLSIDHALGRPLAAHGPLAWALRVALGLAIVLALLLHPLALVVLVGALVLVGKQRPSTIVDPRAARGSLVALGIALVAITLRPAAPLFWDEPVWLAKVRLGPLVLREAALDPNGTLAPRGYPIVGSLAESLLACGREDLAATMAGAAALVGLSVACVLAVLPRRRVLAWCVAMLTMPLVWIHLRSAHLDLVVGLLSLAITLALSHAREGKRGALHAALPIAFLLAGTKDEGIVHVIAACLAHGLASRARPRDAARESGAVLLAALASFATFRVLLAVHGVSDDDHALAFAGISHAPAIAMELVRAGTDIASFGAAWPITIAMGLFVAMRPSMTKARALAGTLALQAGMLAVALLLGTERLVAFTLDGTVSARLLVQLAPTAAWLVCEALASLAPREVTPAASA